MPNTLNHISRILFNVNPDENFCLYVTDIAYTNEHKLAINIEGRIDRESSKIMHRAHLPHINDLLGKKWLIWSYDEYDNDPEDNMISVKLTVVTKII